MSWFSESNRSKHFYYGIVSAFFGTILFTSGLAFGMEFKDHSWGGKFDWIDVLFTELGGVIGQLLQLLTIYLIFFS